MPILGKYHVISGDVQKWSVVADGNIRATRVCDTQLSAIKYTIRTPRKIEGEVIIHNKTGEIDEQVSEINLF